MDTDADDLRVRWFAALGAKDRVALGGERSYDAEDIQGWRQSPSLADDVNWRHYLDALGLTEEQFTAAIAIQLPNVGIDQPGWALEAAEIASSSSSSAVGIGAFIAPWKMAAHARLRQRIVELNSRAGRPFVDLKVPTTLAAAMERELGELAARPILLEAAIAEHSGGLKAHHELLGQLSEPAVRLRILGLYPGLARQLTELSDRWVFACAEFLERLVEDWPLIIARFGLDYGDSLNASRLAESDPHDSGRRVAVLHFRSGRRIVYKPRSLGVFGAYQELLEAANGWGFSPRFAPQKVLDRNDWGWVQFVNAHTCRSRSQLDAFYRRLGGQIALLRLLGASDCHCENLIAAGEQPQFVDLETLLSPQNTVLSAGMGADTSAVSLLADSVLRLGVLPAPSLVEGVVVDLSGLGGRSHQQTPLTAFSVEQDASGGQRIVHAPWRLPRMTNRPRLHGREADPRQFVDEIAAGFQKAYGIIKDRRSEIEEALRTLKALNVRVVLRPTAAYAAMLRDSRHPNALYDGLERDRAFTTLWQGSLNSTVKASELRQMESGDIPFFRAKSDDVGVYDSFESAPLLLRDRSGLAIASDCLCRHDDDDLKRQLALIHGAVNALGVVKGRTSKIGAVGSLGSIDLARRLGQRLEEDAIIADGEATWLAPRGLEDQPASSLGEQSVQLVASNLYSGLAGIVVFLAHLFRVSGDARFGNLAGAASKTLRRRLANGDLGSVGGAFNGVAGAAYAFAQCGFATEQREWRDIGNELAAQALRTAVTQPNLDMISGLSGALRVQLAVDALAGSTPNAATRSAVEVLRDGLLGYRPALSYERGASHGHSGALWAIASAARDFNDPSLVPEEIIASELERSDAGRWIDPGDELHQGQATWCHGSPGIALCRVASACALDRADLLRGGLVALEASRAASWPIEAGLCHGSAGILDAGLVGHRSGWVHGKRMIRAGTERLKKAALEISTADAVPDLSLMTGLSGVGLQLLRTEDDRTPSVLLLEGLGGEGCTQGVTINACR